MGFLHNFEGRRDRHLAAVIQRIQKVDAFDGAAFVVVEVSAHNLVIRQ